MLVLIVTPIEGHAGLDWAPTFSGEADGGDASLNGGAPELSYHAIPPPKLDVVVVTMSLCRFECCAVVSKIKNYRFHEMTVAAN